MIEIRKVPPAPDYPPEEGCYLRGNDYSPVAVLAPFKLTRAPSSSARALSAAASSMRAPAADARNPGRSTVGDRERALPTSPHAAETTGLLGFLGLPGLMPEAGAAVA